VQRVKAEAKTSSGLFLPETAVKELNEAKVLAVGPGAFDRDGKRVAPSVQPGDKVLIPQFGGSPIKVGEDEFTLFRDHEYVSTTRLRASTLERSGPRHSHLLMHTGSWLRSTSKCACPTPPCTLNVPIPPVRNETLASRRRSIGIYSVLECVCSYTRDEQSSKIGKGIMTSLLYCQKTCSQLNLPCVVP
jgi:chaperonin GroES